MGNSTKPNRQNSNDSNGSQTNNNNPAMRLNNTFSGANYNTVSGGRDRRQSNLRKVNSLQNLKRRWIHKTGQDIGNIMRLNQHSPDEIYALKNDQLTMLSNETQLNFSSIDDYYRLFVNISQDRSNDNTNPSQTNTLDRKGFIKLYCLLMEEPEEKTHSIASLTFDALQKDSLGRVNFNEFLIRYAKISRGTIKDKAECTYAIYDIDRKGYVELKDIKRAIRVMMPRMESNSVDEYERLSVECMNFLDVRKTGRISKHEFIEGLAENYVMRSVMCPYI